MQKHLVAGSRIVKSTSEDIAIIISAINSLIADSGNITLELNGRKESLERDLLSLNELSLFTRIRYRKYLSQRIADMKMRWKASTMTSTRMRTH